MHLTCTAEGGRLLNDIRARPAGLSPPGRYIGGETGLLAAPDLRIGEYRGPQTPHSMTGGRRPELFDAHRYGRGLNPEAVPPVARLTPLRTAREMNHTRFRPAASSCARHDHAQEFSAPTIPPLPRLSILSYRMGMSVNAEWVIADADPGYDPAAITSCRNGYGRGAACLGRRGCGTRGTGHRSGEQGGEQNGRVAFLSPPLPSYCLYLVTVSFAAALPRRPVKDAT